MATTFSCSKEGYRPRAPVSEAERFVRRQFEDSLPQGAGTPGAPFLPDRGHGHGRARRYRLVSP